jgi:hypothetical protein
MAALIFGTTVKEYIHLFAQHEDTIHNNDHVCPEGETHLEHEHHHCTFLHFVLEPFANDSNLPFINSFQSFVFLFQNDFLKGNLIPRSLDPNSARGPPQKSY